MNPEGASGTQLLQCLEIGAAPAPGFLDHHLFVLGRQHGTDAPEVLALPLGRVADDVPVGGPAEPLADAEKRAEGGVETSAAVPAKDKLVGIGVDVLGAKAVEGAESPRVEVGEDDVDPAHRNMRRDRGMPGVGDGSVISARQALVALLAVGDDVAPGQGVAADEVVEPFFLRLSSRLPRRQGAPA